MTTESTTPNTPESKSTPRPWRAYPHGGRWFVGRDTGPISAYKTAVTGWGNVLMSKADAELIVTAVNERNQLLQENEKLKAALTSMAIERRDGLCWCGELRNPSGDDHVSWCLRVRAALNPISEAEENQL